MDFQFYLKKVLKNQGFRDFKRDNKDAFLCSCFFVIDKKGKDNKQNFDFFIPNEKKLFSFKLEDKMKKIPVELFDKKIPDKIELNLNFDFDNIEKLILEEMEKEKIKNKIEKMLFSLQKIKGRHLLIGTLFISRFGLIQVQVDVKNNKIIAFEKKSLFDIIKFSRKK